MNDERFHMPKDIFIDNTIAKNFSNPLDPEYKRLIAWLYAYDPTLGEKNAHLVVSHKIIREYQRSAGSGHSATNIVVLINKLTQDGRLVWISNQQIRAFKQLYFKKRVVRRLRSNSGDRNHIPVILLSHRKYALSIDDDFVHDIVNFPGFTARAAKRPQDLPYAG